MEHIIFSSRWGQEHWYFQRVAKMLGSGDPGSARSADLHSTSFEALGELRTIDASGQLPGLSIKYKD